MRNLLQDADRDRLLAPLTGPLAREVELGGRTHRALAEAEDSAFLPAEANARAAELLLLPGLRNAHPALSDALLDFTVAMAEAPLPCRRAVAAGIALIRDDPRDIEVVTPFWRLSGDLSRGELRQESTGATRVAIRHGGNMVEFRAGRHRSCADVEDAVVAQFVQRMGDRILLSQVSAIRGKAGWLGGRMVEAGRLTLTYEVTPGSPVLRVTASFTASRALDRVRITTAADALDEGGLGATAGRLLEDGAWRDAAPPAATGGATWADGTPVAQLVVGAAGWPAGAPVLTLRPLGPAPTMSVTAEAKAPGAVHWLVLRYGPKTLAAGQTLTASEERLLGPAVTAEAMAAGLGGLDLDPAPASGAALHAAATALHFDATGAWRDRLAEPRRASLIGFAERQLARVEASEPADIDLAYAALAADALRRAGLPWAAAAGARLVARLAARLDAEGVLRDGDAPSLAAQAVAALAFARAASWPDKGAAAALDRALGAVTAGAGLTFAGAAVDPMADAEGVAQLARAAGAAVLAAEAGAPVSPGTVERGRQLHRVAVNVLRPLVKPRGDSLAVVGPAGVAPGLQALATLALLAPERLVFGAARPAAAATA